MVVDAEAAVLIEGASGTGKDLLAKVIHSASPRADKPMIKVNRAALSDKLLESEMFGYAKGAFTWADRDKPVRFQMTGGGAILLDEIGDLPLPLQAKLLRILEDKEFSLLGGNATDRVDVLIISATNRGVEKLVKKDLFRKDLYRLKVLRFEMPPLKKRRSDLPLLLQRIMRKLCTARAQRPPRIAENAMKIFLNLPYTGNVRELENILEHALIISRCDVIQPHHLPDYVLDHPPRGNSQAIPAGAWHSHLLFFFCVVGFVAGSAPGMLPVGFESPLTPLPSGVA